MNKELAIQMFAGFQARFPELEMHLVLDEPLLDVLLRVPEQKGLAFPVHLYLTGDELHITAGERFWLEWFPSTWPNIVADYEDAVEGLLSGRYRIAETRWAARLQCSKGRSWRTIGTSGLPLDFLWPSRLIKVLQREARNEA